jgi:hypothetical protein
VHSTRHPRRSVNQFLGTGRIVVSVGTIGLPPARVKGERRVAGLFGEAIAPDGAAG